MTYTFRNGESRSLELKGLMNYLSMDRNYPFVSSLVNVCKSYKISQLANTGITRIPRKVLLLNDHFSLCFIHFI